MQPLIPKSAVPGVRWPAIPAKVGAAMLAMQYQLARSQWWPADELWRQQLRQLSALLAHASETVPFYAQRLTQAGYSTREPLTAERFFSLPLLRRAELQQAFDSLQSTRIPADHGRRLEGYTSGSTGTPLRFCGTEVTHFFWGAITLRDHLWHERKLAEKSAVIRANVDEGTTRGWGASTEVAYETGPGAMLNIRADIDAQIDWLERTQPGYLLTHPSNLQALARRCMQRRVRLSGLLEARTFGEVLPQDLRRLCREAWDAPLVDLYSAEEVGYVALQCPEHEHYHVQAENLLVEILDERGQPCTPGTMGRVVVTTLHNFAMPLIRYDLGDYAEVGAPCACGRGLPVLKRIMGRQRNMVRLPDGTRHWPFFGLAQWGFRLPVRQLQMVQHDLTHIEVRLVSDRALDAAEVRLLTEGVQGGLGYPFDITVTRVDAIARSANLKYEDFLSLIGDPD